MSERLEIYHAEVADTYDVDIMQGLTSQPRALQPKYFYDAVGSQLFEQICELPEYYPTRTEAQILQTCAHEIFRHTGPCEVIELGSGSSTKTRTLLDALVDLAYPMFYVPVDVSPTILKSSAAELIDHYPQLKVRAIVTDYDHLWKLLPERMLSKRIVIFLGSTIGNFLAEECEDFLEQVSVALEPGDYFLVGMDLQKPIHLLEAAYNDSQGITAAFNLNVLRRLNQDFAGNFDLAQFEHWAFYNQELQQIEMHLRSLTNQAVTLEKLSLKLNFEQGETIHTETSRKFNQAHMTALLNSKSLAPVQNWQDSQGWFSVTLCQKKSG